MSRFILTKSGYLEALADTKTTVFWGEPRTFTKNGILDPEGNEVEVDVIIAATGYDQDNMPRYPTIINGKDIATRWAKLPGHTYMAVCSESMPNYFNPGSAYSALYRNWFQVSEVLSKYMAQVINKMQLDRIVSFTVKERAVSHFVMHSDAFMQRLVQSGPCNAWYKTATGRPTLWPGSHSHYMQVLAKPRFEDFDLVYENEDDMFSYMGNGFALHPEAFDEEDSTWYLGQPRKSVPQEDIEKLRGCYATPQWAPNLKEEKDTEERGKGVEQARSSL